MRLGLNMERAVLETPHHSGVVPVDFARACNLLDVGSSSRGEISVVTPAELSTHGDLDPEDNWTFDQRDDLPKPHSGELRRRADRPECCRAVVTAGGRFDGAEPASSSTACQRIKEVR